MLEPSSAPSSLYLPPHPSTASRISQLMKRQIHIGMLWYGTVIIVGILRSIIIEKKLMTARFFNKRSQKYVRGSFKVIGQVRICDCIVFIVALYCYFPFPPVIRNTRAFFISVPMERNVLFVSPMCACVLRVLYSFSPLSRFTGHFICCVKYETLTRCGFVEVLACFFCKPC